MRTFLFYISWRFQFACFFSSKSGVYETENPGNWLLCCFLGPNVGLHSFLYLSESSYICFRYNMQHLYLYLIPIGETEIPSELPNIQRVVKGHLCSMWIGPLPVGWGSKYVYKRPHDLSWSLKWEKKGSRTGTGGQLCTHYHYLKWSSKEYEKPKLKLHPLDPYKGFC